MAIFFPKAPERGQKIAHEGVAWFLQTNSNLLGKARIEELTVAYPHQNYIAKPQDVSSGHLLSAAKPTTWRYLAMCGTNTIGVAELKTDEKSGKALKFIALYPAPAVKMLVAWRKAEELPQIKKQDYEFRYLNFFPTYFFAVWLHGKSDDIIIPLPPTYGRMNANQSYSESEISEILRPEVKKMMTKEVFQAFRKKGVILRRNKYGF